MTIPLINFSEFDQARLATKIDQALSEVGFMMVENLGVDNDLLAEVYDASKAFFALDEIEKQNSAYLSAAENFGYQGMMQENLNPDEAADLKQTFTMRNIIDRPIDDERWPSAEFRDLMVRFYADLMNGARHLQRVLARALQVDEDFFADLHSGENVTLRLLYYPVVEATQIVPGQLGAGAHTDYGMLTLLFQDSVGGLQVQDKNLQWQDVPPVAGGIVINSGDLLERWTNGRYQSTLHRVMPKTGSQERLSIAFFVDPDSSTNIEVLNSCVDADHPSRFDSVTAGEHLQQKIEASHKARYSR